MNKVFQVLCIILFTIVIWWIDRWVWLRMGNNYYPLFYPLGSLCAAILCNGLLPNFKQHNHEVLAYSLIASQAAFMFYILFSQNRYEIIDIVCLIAAFCVVLLVSWISYKNMTIIKYALIAMFFGFCSIGAVIGIMTILYPLSSLWGVDVYFIIFSIFVALAIAICFGGEFPSFGSA